MRFVYKVCSKDEWDHANLNKFYAGSEINNNDGLFICLQKNNWAKH